MSETEFKTIRQRGSRSKHPKRDTFSLSRRSWFHLGHDGSIYVVNQRFGEKSSGQVRLTPGEFQQFVPLL
jgi:hypothetical protein